MKKIKKLKTYTLEELTDKYIGKLGTPNREVFEFELRLELLCDASVKIEIAAKSLNWLCPNSLFFSFN